MIAIIDYDAGNIKSVEKALQLLGEDVAVTRDAGVIKSAERVILPGWVHSGMRWRTCIAFHWCL